MNPKFRFHFLVTAILLGNSYRSFGYSSNEQNPNRAEIFDFAQKQFEDNVVLEIESTTQYSSNILKSLLKPIKTY